MGLFTHKCRRCGTTPQNRTAPTAEARVGASAVEFTNFPYRACSCGRVVRWAFDPGLEFSTQLFHHGVPAARGGSRFPKCRDCGSSLAHPEEVTLRASAELDGFDPIEMAIRLQGYRCPSCGLEQAAPDEFDISSRGRTRTSDTGRALDAAIRSVGLRL
jgi:hypothetical protein